MDDVEEEGADWGFKNGMTHLLLIIKKNNNFIQRHGKTHVILSKNIISWSKK